MSGLVKNMIKKPQIIGIGSAIFALAIDQLTKAIVVENSDILEAGIPVMPGFNLVYLLNDGVSFGLLGGTPPWILLFLTVSICVWLVFLLLTNKYTIECLSYGAILGGAAGNIADRTRNGAVTDFLDFYFGSSHWPAFNLADVFIVSGASLLIFASWSNGHLLSEQGKSG